MEIEEAIIKLKLLQESSDKEQAPYDADGILCDILNGLGCESVVKEWELVPKWYA